MDPYAVLGVRYGATPQQIRAAYAQLVKQFHPDLVNGTPRQAVAETAMRQINAAYAQLRHMPPPPQAYGRFAGVQQALVAGDSNKALALLSHIAEKDAAWHAMAARVYTARGWPTRAVRHYQTALQLEPGNMVYRRALQGLVAQNRPKDKPSGQDSIADRFLRNFFQ